MQKPMIHIHKRRRLQPPPPSWAEIRFTRANFSERTIGNWGNFSACSPVLCDISGRKLTAPINLTSSYAHVYIETDTNLCYNRREMF